MSKSKRHIVSLLALVLCLVFSAAVLAFSACEDTEAKAASRLAEELEGSPYSFPEMGVDLVAEGTVILENENAVRMTGFNEDGVAAGLYYNTDDFITHVSLDGTSWREEVGCGVCYGTCKGHLCYFTINGTMYYASNLRSDSTYPISFECELSDEDGNTDISSEIRVLLTFSGYPIDDINELTNINDFMYIYDEHKDRYPDDYECPIGDMDVFYPIYPEIEVASITGEPIAQENIDIRQHVYYNYYYDDELSPAGNPVRHVTEVHSASGEKYVWSPLEAVSTDYVLAYRPVHQGTVTISVTASNGKVYRYTYATDIRLGTEPIVYVD